MARRTNPTLFVVDGSNIATEGRSVPSLSQLNEAVLAFIDDNPGAEVTVVVDATFGHRIAKKEVNAFDAAVANNELVTPPAGAIGRGDAFVLSIAHKANAGVLSNDSFQEFHGEYDWLFDEGRLIGGKPVPHVGWVFVPRSPVRGPKSRQAVKAAKDDRRADDLADDKARANRRVKKKAAAKARAAAAAPPTEDASIEDASIEDAPAKQAAPAKKAPAAKGDPVNELMPFLEFVERHPVGTGCQGVVESYSSHGAYARVGDVLVYVPLRLMADPPPRSARERLTVGDEIELVIVGFVPDRRSVDAALPGMAPEVPAETEASAEARATKQAAPKKASGRKKSAAKKTAAKKTAAKKTAAKKTAAKKTAAKKTAAKKRPAKKKAAVKKTAAKKKAVAKTAAAKKTAAKKKAPARKRVAGRRSTRTSES